MKPKVRVSIVILILLNIFAIWYYHGLRRQAEVQKQYAADINLIASSMEGSHAMTRDEYFHLQEIDRKVRAAGKMDEADLDWCLQLMNTNGAAESPLGTYVRIHVIDVLRERITYTQPQKDKLFHQVVEKVYALKGPSAIHDKIQTAKLLYITQDKRAVPYLLPLLNEKQNPYAVKFAREALNSMGYRE